MIKAFCGCVILACVALQAAATPVIQHWTTARGTPVYFVPAPEIPIFSLRVVFAAGGARDGHQPGLSALTSGMLGEGTRDLTPDEFHARLEDTGAQMSTGARRDMAWVGLRSLTVSTVRAPALKLLGEMLRRPRFVQDVFTRTREEMLAGLQAEHGSPGALGEKALMNGMYGEHPYGIPIGGTRESVTKFSVAEAAAFYKKYYVARNATIALVGALSTEEAHQIAETVTAALAVGEAAAKLPAVPSLSAAMIKRIPFPGEQSHLFVAQPGLQRNDADYFPLMVGNHVLGGNGTVALLFNEIREKRGLSYSVSSAFEPMGEAGPFVISLQTDHRRESEARSVLHATVKKFITEGPSAETLDAAKQNLIGGFPLRIDNNSKLVEYLTIIGFYRLPLDYLDTYPRAVAAVTAAQIKEAFQRRIHLDRMVEITVGPALSK